MSGRAQPPRLDSCCVIDKRKEQVLTDVAQRCPRETGSADDAAEIALRSVTPTLSMASFIPVPIATPTSAATRAVASLTPCSAIATIRRALCKRVTTTLFWSGKSSTSAMPSFSRRRSVGRWSPVTGGGSVLMYAMPKLRRTCASQDKMGKACVRPASASSFSDKNNLQGRRQHVRIITP